jgi:predicted anti-sigma-YlaC factor YlaD
MKQVDLSCIDVTARASDYLGQRLPLEAHARFEQHLHACSWCMTYLAQLRSTIGMVRRLGESAGAVVGRDKLAALFRRWKQEQP